MIRTLIFMVRRKPLEELMFPNGRGTAVLVCLVMPLWGDLSTQQHIPILPPNSQGELLINRDRQYLWLTWFVSYVEKLTTPSADCVILHTIGSKETFDGVSILIDRPILSSEVSAGAGQCKVLIFSHLAWHSKLTNTAHTVEHNQPIKIP